MEIEKLIPYARNARTHSDAQVAQIAASIREYGFTNPVLIDDQGNIIAGHGRVLGARQLGMTDVPTLVVGTDWSEAKKRAYILADNAIAVKAGWDFDLLRLELQDLDTGELDLSLTGFSAEELEQMLTWAPETGFPELPEGDKAPFQQMTFTLHDDQAEQVAAAIEKAKGLGPFVDAPNENSNGNALARICETFLTHG